MQRQSLGGYAAAIFVALTAALAATPSLAQKAPAMSAPMVVAADGSQSLDLDAADDNFKTWRREDLSGVNTLRARFTPRRVGSGRTPGTFIIELKNSGADALRLYVFGQPGQALLVPAVTHSANTKDKPCFAGTAMISAIELGETAELEIGWSATGAVEVLMRNKASRRINNDAERCALTLVGGPPTSLEVSAVSGRAEWAPLTLGRVQLASN